MAVQGFRVKLHTSLVMPMMVGGVPRSFAILNGVSCAAVVLGLQAIYALPLFVILHFVSVVLAKRDPYFFDVLIRSLRKKKYYDV